MATDYVPPEDDEFQPWQTDFAAWCQAHGLTHGLTATQLTALGAQQTLWNYSWTGFTNLRSAFHGATQDKDTKREAYEALCRQFAGIINQSPATTNEERVTAGLTPRSGTRTPVTVPTTWPILQKIDTSSRTILRLFFADSATPDKRAKPPGVRAAEIWEQIGGTAPVDPETMHYLGAESRVPYRADFEPEDVGKTVYFALRWINNRGEAGPWSPIRGASIPG